MIRIIVFAIVCFAQASSAVVAQSADSKSNLLPVPTGTLGIGRVTVFWTDRSRTEPLAPDLRNRELMLDIWYPAEHGTGTAAPYLNTAALEPISGGPSLQGLLGRRTADLVRTGRVQTHAIEGAPFSHSMKRSPVLIFSHGMGTVPQIYTALIVDLVSHGYVVAAITHTYDAWLTVFPDGRRVPFERDRRNAAGTSEEQQIAYGDTRVEWWANDIQFVLNELDRQDRVRHSTLPFAHHLDLGRAGAFGHSIGGRAAARACQLDRRLRACANQDGAARMMPFYLSKQNWGMDQPFLFITRALPTDPPSDKELQSMGLTLAQVKVLVDQLQARREAAMAATGGGSYRVVLNRAATDHMSFSDLPMLQAQDNAEADRRTRVFAVTSNYIRAFFDDTLRGIKTPLLNNETVPEFVDFVKKYPPARHQF